MKRLMLNILYSARKTYEADKAYYRGLVVRAIEDGVVWFIMFAACWSICHLVGGIFQLLGVA